LPLIALLLVAALAGQQFAVGAGVRQAPGTTEALAAPQAPDAPFACNNWALYVADSGDERIEGYNGETLAFGASVVTVTMNNPRGIVLEPGGTMLVSDNGNDRILRFNAYTGVFLGVVMTAGLDAPEGLAIGPDGLLYVASYFTNNIYGVDRATGTRVVTYSTDLLNPVGLAFDSAGNLYATARRASFLGESIVRRIEPGGVNSTTITTYGDSFDDVYGLTVGPDNFLYASIDGSALSLAGGNRIDRFDLAGAPYTQSGFVDLPDPIFGFGPDANARNGLLWAPNGILHASTSAGVYRFTASGSPAPVPVLNPNINDPFGLLAVPCSPTNVVIRKVTSPANVPGTFYFNTTLPFIGTQNYFTLGHGESYTFTDVLSNTYRMTETLPSNQWAQISATCDNGSNPNTGLRVTNGVTTTCTYTNQPFGSLFFKKIVLDQPTQTFTFSNNVVVVGGSVLTPTFTVGDRDTLYWPNVLTGTYGFTESLPAGWKQTSAVCDNGSPVSAALVPHLVTTTCTVVNERLKSNIGLQKTVDKTAALSGETLVYTIVVTNEGPDDATNVVIRDQLAAGVTLQTANATAGNYVAPLWTIPSAPVGVYTLTLTVLVN
jgi:uncharacterized repeat protein (TIGR01451 family)